MRKKESTSDTHWLLATPGPIFLAASPHGTAESIGVVTPELHCFGLRLWHHLVVTVVQTGQRRAAVFYRSKANKK